MIKENNLEENTHSMGLRRLPSWKSIWLSDQNQIGFSYFYLNLGGMTCGYFRTGSLGKTHSKRWSSNWDFLFFLLLIGDNGKKKKTVQLGHSSRLCGGIDEHSTGRKKATERVHKNWRVNKGWGETESRQITENMSQIEQRNEHE